MIVTDQWLKQHLQHTPHGYLITVDQARILGERFPLQAGWWVRAIGKELTDKQRQRFELRLTKEQVKRCSDSDSLDEFLV